MKWTARDYQQAMRRFALDHLQKHGRIRINLWAGVGTGKTSTTLSIIDALMVFGEVRRVLILATKRIAQDVWGPEIEQWQDFRHITYSIAVGGKSERMKALASGTDVVVINYDVLPAFIAECGENWPFDMVVADESSKLKSLRASTRTSTKGKTFAVVQGGKRARAIGKIAHTKVRHFINLTGSPAPNGLIDIYGPVWLLDAGKRLGRSFSAFLSRWFRVVPRGERVAYEPLPHAREEMLAAIRDITLTIEAKDYMDLPDLIESIVPVHLPPAAMKLYKQFEKEAFLEIASHEIEAFNPATLLAKSRQIASGAVYYDDSGDFEVVHDAKIEALRDEVENANGMPVLVAYQFVSEMKRILAAFPEAEVIKDDPTTIQRWNAGEIPMLLGHPACLHPETEVLTEKRGWVRIVDVLDTERVFDGVEFVKHSGCSFSGYRKVVDLFGITMTPNHLILIDNEWVEARHARDRGDIKGKALYQYQGDDEYVVQMLALRGGVQNPASKCDEAQPHGQEALFTLPAGDFSQDDGFSNLANLARVALANQRSVRQKLWGPWHKRIPGVGGFFSVLRGHAARLLGRFNNRQNRPERSLLKRELPMGDQHGTTGEQKKQQAAGLQRRVNTPSGALQTDRNRESEVGCTTRQRDDAGRGCGGCAENPREGCAQAVFDLVNCGPRNRFLVRNVLGEAFISHNSMGHGLSLQWGSNILIDFSTGFDLELDEQVIGRIGPTRQKQAGLDREVYRRRLVAVGTIEEYVVKRTKTKETVQQLVRDAMKEVGL